MKVQITIDVDKGETLGQAMHREAGELEPPTVEDLVLGLCRVNPGNPWGAIAAGVAEINKRMGRTGASRVTFTFRPGRDPEACVESLSRPAEFASG